jgi:hypothetical protein
MLLDVDYIEIDHRIKEYTLLELACKHQMDDIVKKLLQIRLAQIISGKLGYRFAKEDTSLSLTIMTAGGNNNIIDLLTEHYTQLDSALIQNEFNLGSAKHSSLFSKNSESQESTVLPSSARPG